MKDIKSILVLSLLALLAGCATISVNSDFDPGTDFSNLKTYAWAPKGPEKTGDPRVDNNTLLHTRIHNAIDTELALKGFQKKATGGPTFWIQYDIMAQDKTDITSTRGYWGPYGGWDGYYGYGYGGGGVTTFHYTEGTLIINIADPQTKKLIWRGTGTAVVNPDASPEKRTTKINNAVAKILAKFPPQAK